jgi:hypothetical protein
MTMGYVQSLDFHGGTGEVPILRARGITSVDDQQMFKMSNDELIIGHSNPCRYVYHAVSKCYAPIHQQYSTTPQKKGDLISENYCNRPLSGPLKLLAEMPVIPSVTFQPEDMH